MLAGQSMGGNGAWLMYEDRTTRPEMSRRTNTRDAFLDFSLKPGPRRGAKYGEFFAAIVVVCGYARGHREANKVASAIANAKVPVLVVHSADDVVIPVSAADEMVQALKKHGASNVEYWRYETAVRV